MRCEAKLIVRDGMENDTDVQQGDATRFFLPKAGDETG